MIKILFFDIDGTLLKFGCPDVSQPVIEALNQAHDNGISLFICTGRANFIIPEFKEIPFDGTISFNGSLCYTDTEILHSNPMEHEEMLMLIENAGSLGKSVCAASNRCLRTNFYEGNLADYMNISQQPLIIPEDFSEFLKTDIYQMMIGTTADQDEALMKGISRFQLVRWWKNACDIIPIDSGKDIGIKKILDSYGYKKEEAMAFGDGGNDIPMLQTVGIGVAMGNAMEEVKHIADYVTSGVEEDGIVHALKHFGLI